MREMIIPLNWEYIDTLLENIDSELTRNGFPTVLRMRAQLVVEELFRALLDTEGFETGRLRFAYDGHQSFALQYRNGDGPLKPYTGTLLALAGTPAVYGVKMQLLEGSCTVTVGIR